MLPRLPYSPPSTFHYPKLKILLVGQKFSSNEEIIARVEYFAGLEECTFQDGINALVHQWTKQTRIQGNYIEK